MKLTFIYLIMPCVINVVLFLSKKKKKRKTGKQ